MNKLYLTFAGIIFATALAVTIALPPKVPVNFAFGSKQFSFVIGSPVIDVAFFGKRYTKSFEFKRGLDIQGGMQVVLEADVAGLAAEDKLDALESAREIILRRVDQYGIAEPVVQTSVTNNAHRILVELPGLSDQQQAISLVGQTAQLEFQLFEQVPEPEGVASESSVTLKPTGLTGSMLKKSTVQFDQQTGEPLVSLTFNAEGTELFRTLTTENVGQPMGIFVDGVLIMAPVIQTPILTGEATITGGFTVDDAKQLAIQLNAGALPVPISVLESRTIGASLGSLSVTQSIQAGVVGLVLVMLFMILYYGSKGVIASIALMMYAAFTLALYKIIGITITLPGIAGLLLSIGMALDANILIFERMKEELAKGTPFSRAMEQGFGKAWDSIKDANSITIFTALVLINPLNFSFLNTSGMVRGFGLTLLVGVLLGLFTGIVVTRTLIRLFITETKQKV